MERYTEQLVSIHILIDFAHNNLSNEKMDALEIFLQENDFYAEIMDNLIDLINDHNFRLNDTKQFLTDQSKPKPTYQLKKICLGILEKKYNVAKQSTADFEQLVKSWFIQAPPTEYGVALMGNGLKVLQPGNEISYSNTIPFELVKPIPEKEELLLHIFESGNEKPIVEITFKQPIKLFNVDAEAEKLHPGIYYWRIQLVESGEKAEGSFYIKAMFDVF